MQLILQRIRLRTKRRRYKKKIAGFNSYNRPLKMHKNIKPNLYFLQNKSLINHPRPNKKQSKKTSSMTFISHHRISYVLPQTFQYPCMPNYAYHRRKSLLNLDHPPQYTFHEPCPKRPKSNPQHGNAPTLKMYASSKSTIPTLVKNTKNFYNHKDHVVHITYNKCSFYLRDFYSTFNCILFLFKSINSYSIQMDFLS